MVLSFFAFSEENRKNIYNSIFALVEHGFTYESLAAMTLEEFYYYVKLYNKKVEEEENRARQAGQRAAMNARTPDGKTVGDIIPKESK